MHGRLRIGIKRDIFEEPPDSRAQFIGKTDVAEESRNGRIFRIRLKILRRNVHFLPGATGILDKHLVLHDDEFGRIMAEIFTMNQRVREHLPGNHSRQTDTELPFQKEFVQQMLGREIRQQPITVDEIRLNDASVVIAVDVDFSKQRVRLVVRADSLYEFVLSQQHDSGQSEAAFARVFIFSVQPRAFEQFHVGHVLPWMRA